MMSLLPIGSFPKTGADPPTQVAQLALVSCMRVPEFHRNFGHDPGTFCCIPEQLVCGPVTKQTLRDLATMIADKVGAETRLIVWFHKPNFRFARSMLRFLGALRPSFANVQVVEMNLRFHHYVIIWCLIPLVLWRWGCFVRLRSSSFVFGRFGENREECVS